MPSYIGPVRSTGPPIGFGRSTGPPIGPIGSTGPPIGPIRNTVQALLLALFVVQDLTLVPLPSQICTECKFSKYSICWPS